jgi:hypothetical protein
MTCVATETQQVPSKTVQGKTSLGQDCEGACGPDLREIKPQQSSDRHLYSRPDDVSFKLRAGSMPIVFKPGTVCWKIIITSPMILIALADVDRLRSLRARVFRRPDDLQQA